MAGRAQPVSRTPGVAIAIVVAALILVPLCAVIWRAEAGRGLGFADWAAIRVTVMQAAFSALISVALAIPVARALARRRFWGRSLLITLLGAPFVLPVIVAVLGLLAIFGRGGWISQGLISIGLEPLSIYGLQGVLLAHVFFNLPLATRLILQGWQEIPAERFRLAAQLGAGPRDIWRLLVLPMRRRIVPGALAVVFGICLTSFAVALTLGGGPRATTIELAIYEAFRFEFDLGRAAMLAAVQIVLTLGAALLAMRVTWRGGFGAGLDRPVARWDANTLGHRIGDGMIIAGAAAFLLLPLIALGVEGAPGMLRLPGTVWAAALTSISVAGVSTVLLLLLALPMALSAAQGRGILEVAGLLGLAVSPLVIGTGLFIIIHPLADPAALALPVTALVNAISALPFALRVLVPAARTCLETQGRLALSLNMAPWDVLRVVVIPRLAPQLRFAAGLCAALSMGDLGVITLFANPDQATLPLQIFRLMGSYQMEAAAGAALLLMVLSIGFFWVLDHGRRRHVEI